MHNRTIIVVEVIFFLLLAVGFCVYPWIGDDLGYRLDFHDWFIGNGKVSPATILEAFHIHCLHENSRLANLAMEVLMLLPQLVTGCLSAMLALVSIIYGSKIAGISDRPAAVCFLMAMYGMAMPWIDQMYIFDFQLNYLWAGSLTVFLAYIMLKSEYDNRLVIFILSVIVGAWQEATALPLFIGFCFLITFKSKKYLDIRTISALVGLTIGLAWLYFSPGGQGYREGAERSFSNRMNILVLFALPALIYIVATVCRYVRTRKLDDREILLLPVALSSALIGITIPMGPRLFWISVLASWIGLSALIYRTSTKFKNIAGYLLYGLLVIHLSVVDSIACKERKGYDIVKEASLRNAEEVIFVDMTLREDAPLMALQKPYYNIFAQYLQMRLISRFYRTDGKVTKVVPVELHSFTADDGHTVIGNSVLGNFYTDGKLIVGPAVADEPCMIDVKTDYGMGGEVIETQYFIPFTGADGKPYGWYHYNSSSLKYMLHPMPERISFP